LVSLLVVVSGADVRDARLGSGTRYRLVVARTGRPRRRDGRLARILLIWGVNVVALLAADAMVDDMSIDPTWHVVIVGAVFGLVNWAVKPVVKLLALPVIVITLGIALFFVNLLMLYLTSWLTESMTIGFFGAAVGATIVVWFVNAVLFAVLGLGDSRIARARRAVKR
jgi:putative membrane protein